MQPQQQAMPQQEMPAIRSIHDVPLGMAAGRVLSFTANQLVKTGFLFLSHAILGNNPVMFASEAAKEAAASHSMVQKDVHMFQLPDTQERTAIVFSKVLGTLTNLINPLMFKEQQDRPLGLAQKSWNYGVEKIAPGLVYATALGFPPGVVPYFLATAVMADVMKYGFDKTVGKSLNIVP